MASKELRKLHKQLVAQGFEVQRSNRGHLVVLLNGVRITTVSGTPSDYRSWKNSMAYLKRAGFKP